MASEYTEASVTYYTSYGGRIDKTFPATTVIHKDGALEIRSDEQTTIIPLNDLVGSVVLR